MRFSYLESVDLTDVGKRRKNNEDAALRLPEKGVFCVSDGMGGAQNGEIASQATIDALETAFSVPECDDGVPLAKATAYVRRAADNANEWIRHHSEAHNVTGAGATVVVLVFDAADPRRAAVLHAGDSRAYRFRNGKFERLMKDHSVAAEAGLDSSVDLGPLFRSMVTRAVGAQPQLQLDESPIDVAEGDLFLLCSDGLTNMATDQVIEELIRRFRPRDGLHELAQAMVDKANEAGGLDNTTVTLVSVGKLPATETPAQQAAAEPTAERTPAASERDLPGSTADPDRAQTDEPMARSEPDSGEPRFSDSQEPACDPSGDIECVTPPHERTAESRRRSESSPAHPLADASMSVERGSPRHRGRALFVVICMASAAGIFLWQRSREGAGGTGSSGPPPAFEDSRSPGDETAVTLPAPDVPDVPGKRKDSEAEARPSDSIAVRSADPSIDRLLAVLPTRVDATLRTGEWGMLEEYMRKWSLDTAPAQAESGWPVVYRRWLKRWRGIQRGEKNPSGIVDEYRRAVDDVCAKAGFALPDDSEVAWSESPESRADTGCKVLYELQQHLANCIQTYAKSVKEELGMLGNDPSSRLGDLCNFVGERGQELQQPGSARMDAMASYLSQLDTWLKAFGDCPMDAEFIARVPSKVIPKTQERLVEHRSDLHKRLLLVPSSVEAWRSFRATGSPEHLDRILQLHAQAFGSRQSHEQEWWQNPEIQLALGTMMTEIGQIARIVRRAQPDG